MEQIEKQFINSYQSTLAKKGKEICKEVDSIIRDNDELLVEKAYVYSTFIFSHSLDGVDSKLVERCQNYIDDLVNFQDYKTTFKKVNNNRKDKKFWVDTRNMRIKEI